jgi:uncharacterized protein with PIN domain
VLYHVVMTTTKEAPTSREALEAWFDEVDALLAEIEADKARWAQEEAA